MKGSWWIGSDELDQDQRDIISESIDSSFTILGPPGSGKTNLLILRATHLYLSGYKNTLVIVYTRSLKDFICHGGNEYELPIDRIDTYRHWAINFMLEHGVRNTYSDDYTESRMQILSDLEKLIDSENLKDEYDAILVDEAQDYYLRELQVLKRLASRLVLAGDNEQKIHKCDNSFDEPNKLTGKTLSLSYHYRNGRNICVLGDVVAKKWDGHPVLLEGSNYDEQDRPSSIERVEAKDREQQLKLLCEKINIQLKAYPEELIGIIVPRNEDIQVVSDYFDVNGFEQKYIVHGAGKNNEFQEDIFLCITNLHAAKGLEFRALNMLFMESLKSIPRLRNLFYTAITRCKTSLLIFYSESATPMVDGALSEIEPKPELPSLDDLFTRNK